MTTQIRKPAVAGSFYPDDAAELQQVISSFLSQAAAQPGPAPKAMIVPHAGYIYSGPVAASAYVHLLPLKETIKRVVLLGPSHRVPLNGLAASSASHFATPLGLIPLDTEAVAEICHLPQVQINNEAHLFEHSLEVHLPFLQTVLGDFSLIPLVVGQASPEQVDQVLTQLWDGPETRLVISSDLSHYHDYPMAQQLDKKTSQAIEQLDYRHIQYEDACGRDPINGLLHLAERLGLQATTVDLRNSGDTAGPHNQVVGYGAYLFH